MIESKLERLNDSADVLHPVARIKITNPADGSKQAVVPLLVDTGYSGALTLDASLVSELALEPVLQFDGSAKTRSRLSATGRPEEADVFSGGVDWDGCHYEVEVERADKPLGDKICGVIGMKLLQLSKLTMDVRKQFLEIE